MSNTEASTLAREFDEAADKLAQAAAELQEEAGYLRDEFPDPSWSPNTAQSYLSASRGSREYTIRQKAAAALRLVGADDELIKAVSRGSVR